MKNKGITPMVCPLISYFSSSARAIHTLILYHPETDFVYTYQVDGNGFTLDTRELKEILGDVPFTEPEISQYILDFLTENKKEADQGAVI